MQFKKNTELKKEGAFNIMTKSAHFGKKNTSTKCADMANIKAFCAGFDRNNCDFQKEKNKYFVILVYPNQILNREFIVLQLNIIISSSSSTSYTLDQQLNSLVNLFFRIGEMSFHSLTFLLCEYAAN